MLMFIWLGVVFCGIANGLLYYYVTSPDKYIYMSVVALLCIGFIILYYHHTKNWSNNMDYDEDRRPVFTYSAFGVCLIVIFASVYHLSGVSVAGFTILFPFLAMNNRESMYS